MLACYNYFAAHSLSNKYRKLRRLYKYETYERKTLPALHKIYKQIMIAWHNNARIIGYPCRTSFHTEILFLYPKACFKSQSRATLYKLIPLNYWGNFCIIFFISGNYKAKQYVYSSFFISQKLKLLFALEQ